MVKWVQRAGLSGIVMALVIAASAMASDHEDHERAREALETGKVLPLSSILQKLTPHQRQRILNVELEAEYGVLIYEIVVVDQTGRKLKLHFNAATGELLKSRTVTKSENFDDEHDGGGGGESGDSDSDGDGDGDRGDSD